MEPVCKLYENHPHIIIECQQYPLEVFCLHALLLSFIFVVQNCLDFGKSLDKDGDLVTEQNSQVIHGVVGVLHDIMKKCSDNRLVSKPDIAYNNFGYSNRMQYVRLARTSSDASMRLVGELERLIHQVIIQIMTRISIILKQQVIVMLNHLSVRQFLFFCCYWRHIRFVIHSSYLFYITWISSSNII